MHEAMVRINPARNLSRLLVTGGAGFIGSNFAHYSLEEYPREVEILIYDSLGYAGNPANIPSNARLVQGDICDALFEQVVDEFKPDAVINFAAESHVDISITHPELFMRSNVEGAMHVAKVCADRGIRLHHISTDEVYGDLEIGSGEMFTLDSPYRPSSPYAASKAASDYCIQAAIRTYGLQATISNCTNNFGPRQHTEKLIPRQILRALHGEPVVLYGDGRNERDWIHVYDHNSAVWAILEWGEMGQNYLISARNVRSNRDIVDFIAQHIPGTEITYIEDRAGHDRRYALDPQSVEALGWKPVYSFEEGLAATIEWYKEHVDEVREQFLASERRYAKGQAKA
ncbi:MAG: dTDP-glucose 4,6-dehydratase [Corynebacterium sp.]|nr:dTDP-glucose 4,6-dehydratase [Corynebacterium sp.]